MGTKLLPWSCWQEWEDVKHQLLIGQAAQTAAAAARPHDATQAMTEGIERVRAWRVRGRLPISLDVTAALIEAQLQDTQTVQVQPSGLPDIALRGMYAMAIIRLVNGVADAQQRGRVASSVSRLVHQAGLPPLLVDIRHSSTHGEMPSLPLLRLAAERALEWLSSAYWDGQTSQLYSMHTRLMSSIGDLITSWQAAHAKAATGGAVQGEEEDEEEGEPTEGEATHAYTSADGKAARRTALSEVKALVPPTWTVALVHPTLTALTPYIPDPGAPSTGQSKAMAEDAGRQPSALTRKKRRDADGPGGSTGSSVMATMLSQQRQGNANNGGGAAAAAGGGGGGGTMGAPTKALTACLSQLFRSYPYLCQQLIAYCIYALSAHAARPTPIRARASPSPRPDDPLSQQHTQTAAGLAWWPQTICLAASTDAADTSMLDKDDDVKVTSQGEGEDVTTYAVGQHQQGHLQCTNDAVEDDGLGAGVGRLWPGLPVQHAWAWLRLLLAVAGSVGGQDGGGKKRQRGVGAGVGTSVGGGWEARLSAAQLVELLGVSLHGLSCVLSSSPPPNPGTSSRPAAVHLPDVLQWAVSTLAGLLNTQLDAGMVPEPLIDKAKVLVTLAKMSSPHLGMRPMEESTEDREAALTDAEIQQEKLLESSAALHMDRGEQKAEERVLPGPGSSWSRLESWVPVPIGCLPSACVPSGVLPVLVGPRAIKVVGGDGVVDGVQDEEQGEGNAMRDLWGVPDWLGEAGDGDVCELWGLGLEEDVLQGQAEDLEGGSENLGACRVGAAWVGKDDWAGISKQVGLLI